jgi:hypothetical protein
MPKRWEPDEAASFVAWLLAETTGAEAFATALRRVPDAGWPQCALQLRVPLFGMLPGTQGPGQEPSLLAERLDCWLAKRRAFRAEAARRWSRGA